jgi:hypothetical protein
MVVKVTQGLGIHRVIQKPKTVKLLAKRAKF